MTGGFGPETITFLSPPVHGVKYWVWVKNYSNDKPLCLSEGRVDILLGTSGSVPRRLPTIQVINANQTGAFWNVFYIDEEGRFWKENTIVPNEQIQFPLTANREYLYP